MRLLILNAHFARSTMRLRIRAQDALPHAQFVLPFDDASSLAQLRERIHGVLRRHYTGDQLSFAAEDLVLEVDGFELLDEFGVSCLRDGETVTVGCTSGPPRKKQRAGSGADDDPVREANRIAQLMRAEVGADGPSKRDARSQAQTGLAKGLRSSSLYDAESGGNASATDPVTAAMNAFEERKRMRGENRANDVTTSPGRVATISSDVYSDVQLAQSGTSTSKEKKTDHGTSGNVKGGTKSESESTSESDSDSDSETDSESNSESNSGRKSVSDSENESEETSDSMSEGESKEESEGGQGSTANSDIESGTHDTSSDEPSNIDSDSHGLGSEESDSSTSESDSDESSTSLSDASTTSSSQSSSSNDDSSSDSSSSSSISGESTSSDASSAPKKSALARPPSNNRSTATLRDDGSFTPRDEPAGQSLRADQWVPPGQGKASTKRKNLKRRERERALLNDNASTRTVGEADGAAVAMVRAPITGSLPPGGGRLDILPLPEQPPVAPASSPLEAIAQRMLERTTVGFKKRRTRAAGTMGHFSAIAPHGVAAHTAQPHTPHTAQPAQTTQPTQATPPVRATPPKRRRPLPPSMRPPDQIPKGMTVSSTDCAAWYDQLWENGAQNHSTYPDDDASNLLAHEYMSMQEQVRASLAAEKAQETHGAPSLASSAPSEPDALCSSLPSSFSSTHKNHGTQQYDAGVNGASHAPTDLSALDVKHHVTGADNLPSDATTNIQLDYGEADEFAHGCKQGKAPEKERPGLLGRLRAVGASFSRRFL